MNAALAVVEVYPSGMDDDRLEWHLWNWAQWHARDYKVGRGYPPRGLSGMGCSGASDFDSMVAAVDARCAAAVEAILDGMPPAQRGAIHAIHLHAVYRFPRLNLQACYEGACERLRKGLDSRGIL